MKKGIGTLALASTTYIALLVTIGAGTTLAKTTITHYHKWNNDQGGMFLEQKAIQFKKLTGIEVKVFAGGWDDKLLTMATAGVLPDVMDIWSMGSGVTTLLQDLRPYMEASKLTGKFYAKALAPFEFADKRGGRTKLLALPNSTWMDGIGYNTTLFASSGLVEPPQLGDGWNWDTMVEYALKMTKDTNGDGKTDIYGLQLQDSIHRWSSMVYQAGGELADNPNKPTKMFFSTSAFEAAMNLAVGLLRDRKAASLGWSSDFVSGNKWGMTWDGNPWLFRPQELRIKQDRWFYPKGPSVSAHELKSTGYGISAGSKNKTAAFAWVKYLTSDPENAREWTRSTGRPPALHSLTEQYMSLIPKDTPGGWSIFTRIPTDPNTHVSPNLAPKLSDTIASWVSRMWAGKVSVKQGVRKLDEEANKAIPVANKR